jgi:hypothetical protein
MENASKSQNYFPDESIKLFNDGPSFSRFEHLDHIIVLLENGRRSLVV